MNRILLIDTLNYIHRAYHALPKTFTNKDGQPINAIYGFCSMLINVLDNVKPTHVVCCYDELGHVFRSDSYKEYKATRKAMDKELEIQLPVINRAIEAFGIKRVLVDGFEADDVIGTYSKLAKKEGFEVAIVSNDRDIYQLLGPHIKIFVPDNSLKEGGSYFGEAEFKAKYGFAPENIIDFKALRGDSSDNIIGVPGIGDKTATELVRKFGTIEELYKHIGGLAEGSVKKKLLAGKDSAFLSKTIATINQDVKVQVPLSDTKLTHIQNDSVLAFLTELNFKSLIKRIGFEGTPESKTPQLSMF